MEYFDLVNDNDEVIGTASRDEVYKNNWNNHRGINILIFNSNGEMLVPKRSSNRRIFPNCYDFSVGGHVESGETYIEAAYRELEEELGINGVELEEIGHFNPNNTGLSCFQKLYRLNYDEELNYDKDGIQSIHYFYIEKLKELINNNPEKFKSDLPIIINWYINNFIC